MGTGMGKGTTSLVEPYFYRYKSKYSTTNIQFFLSKFQTFSPAHVQSNVRYKNCVQHKQRAKKKKKGGGDITVFLHTLFVE